MNDPSSQSDSTTYQGSLPADFQTFWIFWMMATSWPWCVLAVISIAAISINFSGHLAIAMLIWVLLCGSVGLSQQKLLQRYGKSMRWWPLATIAGGVVGSGVCVLFFPMFFFTPIIVGTTVSVVQWLVLRDRFQTRTALWIPLNLGVGILSNGLLFLLYLMLGASNNRPDFLIYLNLLIVVGGILVAGTSSFFTALVLHRWIKQSTLVEEEIGRE